VYLTVLILGCFGFSPQIQALSPLPDGGYPNGNTAEGDSALIGLTTGFYNSAFGFLSLLSNGSASFNTGIGAGTLLLNTANENTATGAGALLSNTTGGGNTADGAFTLFSNTGNSNTAIGDRALQDNTTGSGNTALGNTALVINTTGNANTALGFAAAVTNTTGSANTAVGVNSLFSNADGSNNVAVGNGAMGANISGGGNTAIGVGALSGNTDGAGHTAVGVNALAALTTGSSAFAANTAVGSNALGSDNTGNGNTAVGAAALFNTTGGGNTAIGNFAGAALTTGNSNIAVGAGAGVNITTGDFNIDIGNAGVSVDSGTIRIGDLNTQFAVIAGISGATITGAPVVVTTGGQLGVSPSSARFKDEIKPMDKASEALFALKPVTFHYKKKIDSAGVSQFGLVAEDVEKVNPALVLPDKEGKPFTVRYDAVNAMLLNEFLKEHRKVQELETNAARQQKQIEALTAGLQKVSAQLEASKPASQVVNNP
jgi:hypothetical protein